MIYDLTPYKIIPWRTLSEERAKCRARAQREFNEYQYVTSGTEQRAAEIEAIAETQLIIEQASLS